MRSPTHPLRARAFARASAALAAFACLFAIGLESARAADEAPTVEVFEISKSRHFERVERLMNDSAADQVIVRVAEGRYKLRDTFHIARSNVSLEGEPGAILRLANRVQKPVVAVGSQKKFPVEADRIGNIRISDLEIDGNKDKQASEFDQDQRWIRNNGIDVRMTSNLLVERVSSRNNRSGGFVISWSCRDVLARECVFSGNFFDGVAYYDSERVYTVDCVMRDNRGAGVSLDNNFTDSMFARCRLESNRDVGVFARHASRLVFFDCTVTGSGNWAFFLAHDHEGRGVFDIDIASCQVVGNNGGIRMGSVEETQSSRNTVSATQLASNDSRGRADISTAGSPLARFEDSWAAPGAVAYEDETGEENFISPYVEQVDQAILAIGSLSRG